MPPSAAEQRLHARLAVVAHDPRYREVRDQSAVVEPADDGFTAGLRAYVPFAVAKSEVLTRSEDRARGQHRTQNGLVRTVPEGERQELREARRAEARAGDGYLDEVLRRLDSDD
jgi:hypothetical protein